MIISTQNELSHIIKNPQQPNYKILDGKVCRACSVCGDEKFRFQHTSSRGHEFVNGGGWIFELKISVCSDSLNGIFYTKIKNKDCEDFYKCKMILFNNIDKLEIFNGSERSENGLFLKLDNNLQNQFEKDIEQIVFENI